MDGYSIGHYMQPEKLPNFFVSIFWDEVQPYVITFLVTSARLAHYRASAINPLT